METTVGLFLWTDRFFADDELYLFRVDRFENATEYERVFAAEIELHEVQVRSNVIFLILPVQS